MKKSNETTSADDTSSEADDVLLVVPSFGQSNFPGWSNLRVESWFASKRLSDNGTLDEATQIGTGKEKSYER